MCLVRAPTILPSAETLVDLGDETRASALPVPTCLLLLAATISGIALSTHLLGQGVEALVGAERRTFARAYRLNQMFPSLDSRSERS